MIPERPPHSAAAARANLRRRGTWRIPVIGLATATLVAGILWKATTNDTPEPPTESVVANLEPQTGRTTDAADVFPESGTAMASEATSMPDLAGDAITSPWREITLHLEKGDTVATLLAGLGLASDEVGSATAALAPHVSLKRLQVGQSLAVKIRDPEATAPDTAARPNLVALTIRANAAREITLERNDAGDFDVVAKTFEITPKLVHAAGSVEGSLAASVEAAGVPQQALAEMLHAFSWDVAFQHDIKVGDRFAMLVEQSWTNDGVAVDGGKVMWAELTTGAGKHHFSIYRFRPRNGREFFYDAAGRSVIKALLRTPLNMSRVSSRFGMRRHPVLGFTRLHAGVDFVAPPGTPILAAGAGLVTSAGPNGGYGRWVEIDHGANLSTGYAHMARIAPGVRRSVRVRQGQVIGFVGSSGLSTGPHLHFELHRGGKPVNPLTVARASLRGRLDGQDLARFKARVAEIDRARAATAIVQPGSVAEPERP